MRTVTYQVEQKDAWITINRPDKRNAVNYEVMTELMECLGRAESDPNVRAVIVKGSGDAAFCSGGDLSVFHNLKTEVEAKEMLERMNRVLDKLYFFPKPTVALLNGTAIGGGCELATACDYRFSTPQAKIGFVQGGLAITTGWGGGTLLFTRIDRSKAFSMLTSSAIYSAHAAKEMGFVDHILAGDALIEHCQQEIEEVLASPPDVCKAYKAMALRTVNKEELRRQMAEEIAECARLWALPAHEKAVQRFIEKKL
ncbi:enoyl-CoA hydratase/isomerase family protein [Salsuginibacillus kocurii]|uniref:enoyl-CoA hydratase/isomerase family protein n=1 Tax=Salsuginibacillus kocurii TaxID=427078 RepID=UPI000366B8CB|nr:enoyl-CoA hydratase/isomerase family protein [Salsuginibacillus kocurii]